MRPNELREVEAVIIEHPPGLPRSAKRMLNQARLLTRIARDRSVFGGYPRLTPVHLGKWVVLSERWWALADAVTETPELIQRLESAAKEDRLSAVLKEDRLSAVLKEDRVSAVLGDDWITHEASSPAIRALLVSDPPLGEVAARLVHLDPAATPLSDKPVASEPLPVAAEP